MENQSEIQKNAAANPSGQTDKTFAPEDDSAKKIREENLAVNPGDRIAEEPQTDQEKSEQVAVNTSDITGDQITVPTYFETDEPDGEKKELHHVKDSEEISDVIRQARMDDEGNRTWR